VSDPVIPVSVVDARLKEVQTAIVRAQVAAAEAQANFDKVQAELSARVQHVRVLQCECENLLLFRKAAVVLDCTDAPRRNVRMPTAEAIYHMIGAHPGISSGELVNLCEPILDSTSKDKRAVLRIAISMMKKKGRFVVDENGGLHLKKESGVSSNGNGAHP
jgi:hypothetical protein